MRTKASHFCEAAGVIFMLFRLESPRLVVLRPSVWACSLNWAPTFPNWFWGGRIVKNAGKTAVFPPPPPTVRVSQALQFMRAICLQLTWQSAKGLECDSKKLPYQSARFQ